MDAYTLVHHLWTLNLPPQLQCRCTTSLPFCQEEERTQVAIGSLTFQTILHTTFVQADAVAGAAQAIPARIDGDPDPSPSLPAFRPSLLACARVAGCARMATLEFRLQKHYLPLPPRMEVGSTVWSPCTRSLVTCLKWTIISAKTESGTKTYLVPVGENNRD